MNGLQDHVVATQDIHSRLLTHAARRHLRPLGLQQKGRSRSWVDDRGWYLIMVEFQPSGFSKGSYLNVGAHLLWRATPHPTFDIGHRVEDFVSYETESQFGPEADRLALCAAAEVQALRKQLTSPGTVATLIPDQGLGWKAYQRAIALALSDQGERAAGEFHYIAADLEEEDRPVFIQMREDCKRLAVLAGNPTGFRSAMLEVIAGQRAQMRLPVLLDPLAG